jgi:ferredoxin-NADP reductase
MRSQPLEFDTVVSACSLIAEDALRIDLVRSDGQQLPSWSPGSHVDVLLPTGVERQYSLCGQPGARSWTIVVLREDAGRGGSVWLHASVRVGMGLRVRGPSNHFEIEPAPRYRFIAAGIGITAILPMVRAVAGTAAQWRLDYAVSSARRMAFRSEVESLGADRVTQYVSDHGSRLSVDSLRPEAGELIYACGPARLLDALAARSRAWSTDALRLERFEPVEAGDPVRSASFTVDLTLSGGTYEVASGQSILDVVEQAGVFVLSSCREGTCGTCETVVLDGTVDHRDSILTESERRANDRMMICVSRASSPSLTLEL